MDAAASGLILCLLGAVLLRRDLRSLLRRATWRPAQASVAFEPGPSWRIGFSLPDGRRVEVVTTDLRLVARREDAAPLTVLYDPKAPGRGVELPARPGLAFAVGLGLLVLGGLQLLR